VLFLDNRYIPGSSTAISRTDVDGNTYQLRLLDSGSVHEVLKNFPEPTELEQALAAYGSHIEVELLDHYWCVTYQLPDMGGVS
jgi:demethylmenaquinone methyltransferase/2-methoxy-6-polyprenyl-1,4-benzoquinol methylase